MHYHIQVSIDKYFSDVLVSEVVPRVDNGVDNVTALKISHIQQRSHGAHHPQALYLWDSIVYLRLRLVSPSLGREGVVVGYLSPMDHQ